jgi:hypothetical protein
VAQNFPAAGVVQASHPEALVFAAASLMVVELGDVPLTAWSLNPFVTFVFDLVGLGEIEGETVGVEHAGAGHLTARILVFEVARR